MDIIWEGIVKAFQMLIEGDPEIFRVTMLTLQVSGTATLISLLLGVPLGALLALTKFPGRKMVMSLVNTGMGLPPVVVGLWVTLFLWRSGPFGALNLIYTPWAMIIAQAVIASPIIIGLTSAAVQQIPPMMRLQIRALGATRRQYLWFMVRETRYSLLAAVMAGFGAVVSEVGASMMVGGNIRGETRVLTTATVMEVSKGNFDVAIALSVILSVLSFSMTWWLTHLQQRGEA